MKKYTFELWGKKYELITSKPIVKAGHEVHICRLHRDGFTFAGDSRDYIDLSGYHYRIHHYDFHLQDGKPELAVNEIVNTVKWKHTQIK